MLASLFAGVAGLRNHQVRMNVIGNNISNINTVGFKSGRSVFQEALVQTLRGAGRPSAVSGGSNPIQLGLGMNVASIDNLFTQGGLELTGQISDLAIQGNGFFILSDGNQKFYTRAGAFGFDANSYLVNPSNGLYVQGKMADASGQIPSTSTVGNIQLPFGQQDPAKVTTRVSFGNNLDASATRADASLIDTISATNGITLVSGVARDGAGGTHTITIGGGANATFATDQGDNLNNQVLTGNESLGSLGVTSATLTLAVDTGSPITITGLSTASTINDLVNAIDIIDGIDASLVGGEVEVRRTMAGASHTVTTNLAVAGDVANRIFGAAPAAAFVVNNGTDHTLTATDVFVPSVGGTPVTTVLGITSSPTTGLATGVTGLGGGGVTVSSGDAGLKLGVAVIETKDTAKATSLTVFDSLGGTHTLMTNFIKSHEPNKWYWQTSLQGGEVISAGGSGTVDFNADGSLLRWSFDGGADRLIFDPMNGAGLAQIDLFAGTSGKYDGLTGFSGVETVAAVNQDGYGMGILDKISIDPTGLIIGIFTNGVSRNLAQITLADFNNEAGLLKSGESLFQTSANSGEGIEGVAGETVSATISSGALESANVDLAQEFTNMIIAQRGFQSNARVITTSDNMLDDLVNLKR
ncbi:MAG: flagellar hook-basal body complex protein [Candidatus Zixiibacteriota bacterium]